MLDKQDIIKGLEESFEVQEQLFEGNLTRMAQLHDQIEAIKESQTRIRTRMGEIRTMIKKVKEKNE